MAKRNKSLFQGTWSTIESSKGSGKETPGGFTIEQKYPSKYPRTLQNRFYYPPIPWIDFYLDYQLPNLNTPVGDTPSYWYGHYTECFVAGTKVIMKDGPDKNIEDVKMGDEVLSYNIHTKQFEPKKVTELFTQTHNL